VPTETIDETIDVGAVFKRKQPPAPKWFFWRGRKYDVTNVEMTWTAQQGEATLLFFALSAGAEVYEVHLNQKTLNWVLEKIHLP
jgi:hypothetical protein